jgi:hypothetical protein
MRYFTNEHLPEPLKSASMPFCALATWAEENLPAGPEKTVCLRKLLEAKDAAVRTALDL